MDTLALTDLKLVKLMSVNSSSPGENGLHFANDIFKGIFMNEKFCVSIKISLKFVPKRQIDNKSS